MNELFVGITIYSVEKEGRQADEDIINQQVLLH